MPPAKKLNAAEVQATVLGGTAAPWPVLREDDRSPLDLAEETHLAVIRERVRNGTADFQDARWLLGVVDKLLA